MSNWNWVAARLERNMILFVRRVQTSGGLGGEMEDVRIEFWPRTKELSEAYEWVEM
jgi:hypothetical protein